MELSRRDALTALAAAGITATAGCGSSESESTSDTGGSSDDSTEDGGEPTDQPDLTSMETLVAVGEVLYPSQVEVTQEFVETFMFGRITDEEAYEAELTDGIDTLDQLSEEQQGATFGALSRDERITLFQESELRSGDSVPDGSGIERFNYHVVDELLFAFYSSPTAGELVGNPNPRGFPGGFGYRGPS